MAKNLLKYPDKEAFVAVEENEELVTSIRPGFAYVKDDGSVYYNDGPIFRVNLEFVYTPYQPGPVEPMLDVNSVPLGDPQPESETIITTVSYGEKEISPEMLTDMVKQILVEKHGISESELRRTNVEIDYRSLGEEEGVTLDEERMMVVFDNSLLYKTVTINYSFWMEES